MTNQLLLINNFGNVAINLPENLNIFFKYQSLYKISQLLIKQVLLFQINHDGQVAILWTNLMTLNCDLMLRVV